MVQGCVMTLDQLHLQGQGQSTHLPIIFVFAGNSFIAMLDLDKMIHN